MMIPIIMAILKILQDAREQTISGSTSKSPESGDSSDSQEDSYVDLKKMTKADRGFAKALVRERRGQGGLTLVR